MIRIRLLRVTLTAILCGCAIASFASSTGSEGLAALQQQYRRTVPAPFPDDNPFSAAKATLGRQLFFDPVLSRSGSTSCGSCHQADLGWGDGRRLAIGDAGHALSLHSPSLLEIASLPRLGWDGKFDSIEAVTVAAVSGAYNMNLPAAELMARLSADPAYVAAFEAAFGPGAMTFREVELAVATFERTIVAPAAPFDRWLDGDRGAIEPAAVRGFELFNGRAGCSACHSGPGFTDGSFHDIGTASGDDRGRGKRFPSSVKLQYAFKTPTLRDVVRRAPYMHNGTIPDLAAVIEHYDGGGVDRPSRSPLMHPLGLSASEKADLQAFLQTLGPAAPGPGGNGSASSDPHPR